MNRRGFLSSLAAIAANATLDPERALWTPKRYVQGVTLTMGARLQSFAVNGYRWKIGDTVQVRLPERFKVDALFGNRRLSPTFPVTIMNEREREACELRIPTTGMLLRAYATARKQPEYFPDVLDPRCSHI